MDIVDVAEDELTIAIVAQVLVATSLDPVGCRRYFGARIVNDALRVVHLVVFAARLAYLEDHVFVIGDSLAHESHIALRTAPDGAAVGCVVVG